MLLLHQLLIVKIVQLLQGLHKLTVKVDFNADASQDSQNELAKLIKNQGVTADFTSTFDTAAHSTYKLTLNGSNTSFSVVAKADAGKFEIQDTNGNKIADVTVGGGVAATKADAPVHTTDNITAAKATAAKVDGEKAAYYDRDGNKIAENALSDYFSVAADGTVAKRVDAPTVYDALGNAIDLRSYRSIRTERFDRCITVKASCRCRRNI